MNTKYTILILLAVFLFGCITMSHGNSSLVDNNPPDPPLITGSTNGMIREPYQYIFSSTDPDGDTISYLIDWGDGSYGDDKDYTSLNIAPHPQGGIYLGQYEWLPGDITTFEEAIDRKVAWFSSYGVMSYDEKGYPVFDVANAKRSWNEGRIVLAHAIEADPGPPEQYAEGGFTIDNLCKGVYDEPLSRLADQFRAFGKPLFFHTAREPLGIGADYMGGFGPNGNKSTLWALEHKKGFDEFDPSGFPYPELYEDLGDPTICDGVERLVAAQRYYHHFFIEQEGLDFLTFDTMGWVCVHPDWLELEINETLTEHPNLDPLYVKQLYNNSYDFANFYPGDDYVDWISINYYALDWRIRGRHIEIPTEFYLQGLNYTINTIRTVAPEKPIYFLEFGFADGMKKDSVYAAQKLDASFHDIIEKYPEINGFSMWSYHPLWHSFFPFNCLIRPGTHQGNTLKQIISEHDDYFHSSVYFSDGSIIPTAEENNSIWIGPYSSGDEVILDHMWFEEDTYRIRAKAKDSHGLESEWATVEVTLPKTKPVNDKINNFLKNIHEILFRMIGEKSLSLPHSADLTQGEYMQHHWFIDRNHMLWWDWKPSIRYGFTGNPSLDDLETFIQLGFNQFQAYASESLYVFSTDPQEHELDRENVELFTEMVTNKGCTYFAGLNTLLPWKNSGKILAEDMITFSHNRFVDVTEEIKESSEIIIDLPFENIEEDYIVKDHVEAYLFDFTGKEMMDISENIEEIYVEEYTEEEEGDERDTFHFLCIVFSHIELPESDHIVIAASIPVKQETVMTGDFPALWKNNIKQYYLDSLEFYKSAYQKEGLRGMIFGDEIAYTDRTLFSWMEEYSDDPLVMDSYHQWLTEQFETIDQLNEHLTSDYPSFDAIPWYTTPLPYESFEHMKEEDNELFGLFTSVDQLTTINTLQNEFLYWFYGYWYAEYASYAKQIIGDVPVFTTAWTSSDSKPLQQHYQAMVQGIDGFVRNSYGRVVIDEQGNKGIGFESEEGVFVQDLQDINDMIQSVEHESGQTKAYFANEFYWVKENNDAEENQTSYFAFPSKQDMKEFLNVMIDHGYRGFHLFLMNPSEIWHSSSDEMVSQKQDMQWFSEIKSGIIRSVYIRNIKNILSGP